MLGFIRSGGLTLRVAILLISLLSIGGIWTHGYLQGKSNVKTEIITKTIEINRESEKQRDEVEKKERSLDVIQLDNALCNLGIVRSNSGCK